MALTLNERLVGVRAGMNGIARRIRGRLESLENLEKHLEKDPTVITMFRLCVRDIRAEIDELADKE